MHWILTGLLIAASAATAAYTGWLVRRLFTLDPGVPETPGPADRPGEAAEPDAEDARPPAVGTVTVETVEESV